jgi:hypothetical protein
LNVSCENTHTVCRARKHGRPATNESIASSIELEPSFATRSSTLRRSPNRAGPTKSTFVPTVGMPSFFFMMKSAKRSSRPNVNQSSIARWRRSKNRGK